MAGGTWKAGQGGLQGAVGVSLKGRMGLAQAVIKGKEE